MQDTSWSGSQESGYRLPGSDHLGWWAAVAMVLSVFLHVVVFFVLDQMKIDIIGGTPDISTGPVRVQREETETIRESVKPAPEETIKPPASTDKLLDEVDLLNALPKDPELDVKPDVNQAEWALKMSKPAAAGDSAAIAADAASSFEVDDAMPELGRQPETIRPAAIGQLTVDPGSMEAEDDGLGKMADSLIRKGANGKVKNGALDGVASLDELLDLPTNLLLSKKTLLPSDLLFEFNSAELRESARVGLMKLALLMDRNPGLYCWIEGHTDLIGGDESNLELSIRRAESVKKYLVDSLRMDPAKIYTRGFGRYEPIVISGNADQQSINRRVEVRMRKTPPTAEQMKIVPQKATVVEETPPAPRTTPAPAPKAKPVPQEAPRAVIVKPRRAMPVEEPPAPRAAPVEQPRRAQPVEAEPALPLRPLEVPRALPIDDE